MVPYHSKEYNIPQFLVDCHFSDVCDFQDKHSKTSKKSKFSKCFATKLVYRHHLYDIFFEN